MLCFGDYRFAGHRSPHDTPSEISRPRKPSEPTVQRDHTPWLNPRALDSANRSTLGGYYDLIGPTGARRMLGALIGLERSGNLSTVSAKPE